MKNIRFIIAFATFYLIIYNALPFWNVDDGIIISLFIVSPFVVVYMVYSVLKHGEPSTHNFTHRFYEDLDYERNVINEPTSNEG